VPHISRGGTWDLPGGVIEPEERLLEGLRREVFEESGIKINKVLFPLEIGYFNAGVYKYKNVIRVTYLSRVKTMKVRLSGEHNDFVWLSIKDLKKIDPIYFIDPRIYCNLLQRVEHALTHKHRCFEEKVD
jgi:8-oxo-dGTP diphosphatase